MGSLRAARQDNASGEDRDTGARLAGGKSFGELALMYNTPRAVTVKAMESSVSLWTLKRPVFRQIILRHQKAKTAKYTQFLAAVRIAEKPLGELISPLQVGDQIIRQARGGNVRVRGAGPLYARVAGTAVARERRNAGMGLASASARRRGRGREGGCPRRETCCQLGRGAGVDAVR